MPTTTLVILSLIVSVFVVFGMVLAWADRRTRYWGRNELAYWPKAQGKATPLRAVDSQSETARTREAA